MKRKIKQIILLNKNKDLINFEIKNREIQNKILKIL